MTTADFLIEDPFSGFSGEDKLKAHPKKFQKIPKNGTLTTPRLQFVASTCALTLWMLSYFVKACAAIACASASGCPTSKTCSKAFAVASVTFQSWTGLFAPIYCKDLSAVLCSPW